MKKKITSFLYILAGTAVFQAILILYNHYTGFARLNSVWHYLFRLLTNTPLVSIFVSLCLWFDLNLIRRLDKRISWEQQLLPRLVLDIISALGVGVLMGLAATATSHTVFGYNEPLQQVFLYNGMIGAVLNFVLFAGTESVMFYKRHRDAQLVTEKLERENLDLRFDMLKKQLDPHFLFNSLNVLSSLIRRNPEKAQDFIDEFSHVYRYTLEVIEKPVVTLGQELEFAQAYLFLQNIRFEHAVTTHIEVEDRQRTLLVPPLAVQVLLENAFKHNIVDAENPMTIRISVEKKHLKLSNTLRPKSRQAPGKRLGFENLKNRYALISESSPEVVMTETEYIVILPLLEAE